jgi:alpha-galactosidase
MALHEIQNNFFHLKVSPDEGVFSLLSKRVGLASFEKGHIKVSLIKDKKSIHLLTGAWEPYQLMKTIADSIHGKLRQLEFSVFIENYNQIIRLTFALSEEYPVFLWKATIENQSSSPVIIDKIELINLGYLKEDPQSLFNPGTDSLKSVYAFHSNGWQSWSFSGTFAENQKQKHTRLKFFQDVLVQNAGTPAYRKLGIFSSDFFGVLADRNGRTASLFGFLSQKQQFGTVETELNGQPKLRMWANGDQTRLDPGHNIETDWAIYYPYYFDQPDPLKIYYEAVEREHQISLPDKMPAGWCSWYHFYQNIDEKVIAENLKSIQQFKTELPLELVQIDDGFQKEVGDWLDFRKGFPNGVAPLSEEIKSAGLTPGLWLAPFILHPNSDYAMMNPDKILRNKHNHPVNAGFIWNVFTQALDLSNPDALEYALEVVDTAANKWGFPYLKLDFLYAGALPGKRFDQTRTRAQILRAAMQAVRERVGKNTFILACGAPLGSVLGLVEANRIGPDVSGDWTPKYFGTTFFFEKERSMPSARNSIQNILTRAEMHDRWWINDPDCLLVRSTTNLKLAEVQTLASVIAITGGSLLISDDLPTLEPERRRIAEVLLPVIGKRAFVMDWLDTTTPHNLRLDLKNSTGEWQLLARFNWKENVREVFVSFPDFCLPKLDYWAYSFWNQKIYRVKAGDPIQIPSIQPHGVAMLALRPIVDQPQYLGSDIHISMGLEIEDWKVIDNNLQCKFNLPRKVDGQVFIFLPKQPAVANLNHNPTTWKEVQENIFQFHLQFDQEATLEIIF